MAVFDAVGSAVTPVTRIGAVALSGNVVPAVLEAVLEGSTLAGVHRVVSLAPSLYVTRIHHGRDYLNDYFTLVLLLENLWLTVFCLLCPLNSLLPLLRQVGQLLV